MLIINRLPTPLLKDKSPYKLLTAKKVDYDGLKVFGCLAYYSSSPKQRHKFQPRSKPCVFIGYPAGYKGYKLLDLESNTIHISRNVTFHEAIFPYTKTQTETYEDFFASAASSTATTTTTSDSVVQESTAVTAADASLVDVVVDKTPTVPATNVETGPTHSVVNVDTDEAKGKRISDSTKAEGKHNSTSTPSRLLL